MSVLVRITGKDKEIDFVAAMILSNHHSGINHDLYKIIKSAPILKKHFIQSSSITIDQIKAKCKREGWLLEIMIDEDAHES